MEKAKDGNYAVRRERGRKRKAAGHGRKALGSLKNSCFIKQRAQGNIVPTRKRNGMCKELYFLTW